MECGNACELKDKNLDQIKIDMEEDIVEVSYKKQEASKHISVKTVSPITLDF